LNIGDSLVRFLLNENISGAVIRALREQGHDVLAAKESMRGELDEAVLARARAEQRIVVTQDKDFGELAFRAGMPMHCGIILFRLSGAKFPKDDARIIDVLNSRDDFSGHFSVVTETQIRIRPLPEISGKNG